MHRSIENQLKKVVAQALNDEQYKQELTENKDAILEDIGLATKNGIEIEFKTGISSPIFENGFLYIPLSKEWLEDNEDLSDDELLNVAGGFNYFAYLYKNTE